MGDVQRWASWCNDPMREVEWGKWVTYADHVRVVAELREAHEKALRDERLRTITEYAPLGESNLTLKGERTRLIQALRSCVIGATEAQSDSDGFVSLYVTQTGPIHRAIALLQEFGYHDRPGFDSLIHDSDKEE